MQERSVQLTVTPARLRRRNGGFSLIEVLFAIGLLGTGVVGVLALFTTGLSAANYANNLTNAAMEAQTLYTRVLTETDNSGRRVFLYRIQDPNNATSRLPANDWIHDSGGGSTPIPMIDNPEFSWQCRVTHWPMDKEDPLNPAKDNRDNSAVYPAGLFQLCIAVYRNSKPGEFTPGKDPIIVVTSFVTAGY